MPQPSAKQIQKIKRRLKRRRAFLQKTPIEKLSWREREELRDLRIKDLEQKAHIYRTQIFKLSVKLKAARDELPSRRTRAAARRHLRKIRPMPGLTAAEHDFCNRALNQGYETYRAGWPNFLLIHKQSRKPLFVEVKSPTDTLTDTQRTMFKALEEQGLQVHVYRTLSNKLTPWRHDIHTPKEDRTAQKGVHVLMPKSEDKGASCSACGPEDAEEVEAKAKQK